MMVSVHPVTKGRRDTAAKAGKPSTHVVASGQICRNAVISGDEDCPKQLGGDEFLR